jgi:hypothetical protein
MNKCLELYYKPNLWWGSILTILTIPRLNMTKIYYISNSSWTSKVIHDTQMPQNHSIQDFWLSTSYELIKRGYQ